MLTNISNACYGHNELISDNAQKVYRGRHGGFRKPFAAF